MNDAADRAADELYGLPLDEFTPRRDALARELRAAGQREDADEVKRLPKPSAPAWVVNQLARERPDELRELLDAGEELRRVQEWLLRREAEPADLRSAVEAERGAVARLVHAGAAVLVEAGRAPRGDVLERIGETLHAAAADPDVRADVERGRVVRDRAAVGLGPGAGAGYAAAGTARRGRGAEPAAKPRRARGAAAKEGSAAGAEAQPDPQEAAARKRAAAEAREAVRAAEAEAKAADRMHAAADRAVDRALRALQSAESNWEQAQDELQSARVELAAAEKAAGAAREAAELAEAELEERRRRAEGGAE